MGKILRFLWMWAIVVLAPCSYAQTKSVFAEKLKSFDGCWFCGPFGDVFDISNDITTSVCEEMRPVFLSMLGLFFLFWLLFRVGRMVVDITPAPDTQLVPDLFKQSLRVIFAALMLVFYMSVFRYVVGPVLETAIGVGSTISLNEVQGQKTNGFRDGPLQRFFQTNSTLCPDYDAARAQSELGIEEGGKVYSETVKQSFICYVRVGTASLTAGMAIGATAISGWAQASLWDKIGHLDLLFIGIVFMVSYFMLMLAFPTKLFDPLMTLTFVSALFPLWVVLWAFPATKKYFDKAKDLFIGVLVHLVVISVVTVMVVNVMNSALGDKRTRDRLFTRLLKGEDTYKVFTTTEGFGLAGKALILTLALAWLANKMFEKVGPIAAQFEGVVDFGVGKSAQTFISQGTGLAAEAGKQTVAATYHGTKLGWNRLASRDDGWGKAARGLGTAAVGAAAVAAAPAALPAALGAFGTWAATAGIGVGAAAAAHRFMPVPKNRPHGASWRDRLNVREFDDELHTWMVNRSRGQTSSQNKRTKEWEKYDRNSQLYQEFDSAGRIQNEYDRNRGNISLGDKKYKFSINASNGALTIEFDDQKYTVDLNGNVQNEKTHVAVDDTIAAQVRDIADFQRHAEQRIAAHEGILRSRMTGA